MKGRHESWSKISHKMCCLHFIMKFLGVATYIYSNYEAAKIFPFSHKKKTLTGASKEQDKIWPICRPEVVVSCHRGLEENIQASAPACLESIRRKPGEACDYLGALPTAHSWLAAAHQAALPS